MTILPTTEVEIIKAAAMMMADMTAGATIAAMRATADAAKVLAE